MKRTHPVTHIPILAKSKDKETIHIDIDLVASITEPIAAHRCSSGGAEIYSWFKITFREGLPELVFRSTDIGNYTWEQVNELFANQHEFPFASTQHLRKVFEAAYEAWTGRTYKIEG